MLVACRNYSVPQTCVLPYMTLSYNESNPAMAASFANQLGVNTSLPDFGSPKCAPFYYPIYSLLSTIGYTAGGEAAHWLQQENASGEPSSSQAVQMCAATAPIC